MNIPAKIRIQLMKHMPDGMDVQLAPIKTCIGVDPAEVASLFMEIADEAELTQRVRDTLFSKFGLICKPGKMYRLDHRMRIFRILITHDDIAKLKPVSKFLKLYGNAVTLRNSITVLVDEY